MRDCPYCGNPMPIDRSRSCGELECRRLIRSGRHTRPRRRPEPALADTLPPSDLRFLGGILRHTFSLRIWE